MRKLFNVLALVASCLLGTSAFAQLTINQPPPPQAINCTGGNSVTGYPAPGSALTCGTALNTGTINTGTLNHIGEYTVGGTTIGPSSNMLDSGSLFTPGEPIDLTSFGVWEEYPNDTTTGTSVNTLTKLTGGNAIISSIADLSLVRGVTVGNAGKTGNAQVAVTGRANLAIDGATTAGDIIQISPTVAGNGHDTGAGTCPTNTGQVIGKVLSTNASAGTYAVALGTFGCGGGGVGTSTNNQLLANSGGNIVGITPAGDVTYASPNFTVAKINGVPLGSTTATSGNVLVASGSQWASVPAGGDIASISASGAFTIANGAITNAKLVSGLNFSNFVYIPLNPANNLSDLGSMATSRANLGLGTNSTPNFSGLVLGSQLSSPLLGTTATGAVRAITLGSNLSLGGTNGNVLNTTGSLGINQLTSDVTTPANSNGPTAATVVALQGVPVSASPPTTNQILTYSGTNWAAAAAPTTGISQLTGDATAGPGSGSQALTLATVNATIGTYAANTINAKGLVTGGAALSGDVTTSGAAATVTGLQGRSVNSTAPTLNQILAWNGSSWAPSSNAGTALNGVAYPASPSTNTVPVVTAPNTITYETVPVAAGGTGATSLTAHGILLGEGTSAVTPTAAMTNGQVLIGSSAADPVPATLTAGANVTITNGAGSITIASSGGAGAGCTPAGSAGNIVTDNGAGACTSDTATNLVAGALSLGSSGTPGSVKMGNATSGTLTLQPATGALGTVTATLPANTGTLAELNLAQTWSANQSFNSGTLLLNGATSGNSILNAPATGGGTATLFAGTDTIAGKSLANGGSGAALTASNGGIVYSTGSAMAILAGTATANLPLLSGLSTTPSWAAISYPTSAISGGIPYFSSTSAMASSAALTAGLPVIGGGAGVAPSSGTRSGNTTGYVTYTGSPTSTDYCAFDVNGNCTAVAPVVFPASGNVVLANGTQSPAGLAPANGNVIFGAGGVWTSASLASSLPIATTTTLGAVKGDASTLTISGAGVISCTTAAAAQIGCVRPDNSTITISSGVISAPGAGGGTVNAGTAGQVAFYATSAAAVSGENTLTLQQTNPAVLTGMTIQMTAIGGI